jgi:DNA-binding CsgD family transcriptional regulator
MDGGRIAALIETVYASAFEEDGWDNLLQTMRMEFHASEASIEVRDRIEGTPLFIASTLEPSCLKPYYAYYYKIDPSSPAHGTKIPSLTQPQIYTEEAYTDRSTWLRSEFYNDFIRGVCDMGQPLGCILNVSEHEVADFLIHRPPSGAQYNSGDRKLLRMLAPHLNRSLHMYRELEGLHCKTRLFENAFDAHPTATFMLDAAGLVLSLNARAEALLEGGPLTVRNGRLIVGHPPDDARLAAALVPLRCAMPPAALVLRGAGYAPGIRLYITPVNGGDIPMFFDVTRTARTAFLVTAVPLDPTAENLIAAYGLTRAEAEVALLLTRGLRAPQIAARRETSIDTVNTQLKQIYAKTGVDGQVALLIKLLGR